MARPAGTPKTGGRKVGTPNKRSLALSEALETKGLDPIGQLVELLPILRAKEQADVLLSLLPYMYPRRKSVEVTEVDKSEKISAAASALVGQKERLRALLLMTAKMNGAQELLKPGVSLEDLVTHLCPPVEMKPGAE